VALAVGGIRAGEQCVVVSLSVPFRMVRGMSEHRFGRTPGGVCSLGLHLVWCPKYRRRILGGRVGPTDAPARVVWAFKGGTAGVLRREFVCLRRLVKVLWSPSYFAASVGYVSGSMVRRFIEQRWDAVAS
jgi:putative transposase